MKSLLVFLLSLCAAVAVPSVSAMSVVPPTFSELVAESATIARARVSNVTCRRVSTPQGETIKTFVTFEIAKSLKGTPATKLVLSFLGGQVGLDRLEVPGMPQFQVAAEEYLFVSGKPSICPLVGVMHGRYRILTAQKEDRPYVARDDRSALVQLGDVALPMRRLPGQIAAASVSRAISPEAFEAAILAEVAQPSTR